MDASRNYPPHLPSHFQPFFVQDPNINQFVDLFRGETRDFDYDLTNDCFVDKQTGADAFDFDCASAMVPDPDYGFNSLPSFDEEDNSSGTTTKKAKVDRSRTLISERRRRGRMKEKLYALRSLVPNITKMDKASIIGDAVLYVQDLQMKARKLEAEIADLEASMAGSQKYQEESIGYYLQARVATNNHPIYNKILKLDMFQVEEKGFYIRVVCNKSEGVALSLYRALESLTNFKIPTWPLFPTALH
ncbi:FER-like regulator of iron uptake, FER-LIKE IRON DEFICIENCY INDUCED TRANSCRIPTION FACTOR [Hibiscus trionum]|uniref:FER-like regulator of iron uptake, FER-LIKE IRON DEFICIENCY INDUCED TRANSCRIPTION FACTOR n=1 Tax=Hibiscus trionum TaxID=183268 RepID=A0A9W7JC91_HIBTR|nr:FER-like regulator of iron uptake, FER-LIKE IRON DEFICIENCY INDUCED TRANSCRIPTION FACTOR [Hibiscus trionum]